MYKYVTGCELFVIGDFLVIARTGVTSQGCMSDPRRGFLSLPASGSGAASGHKKQDQELQTTMGGSTQWISQGKNLHNLLEMEGKGDINWARFQ